MGKKIARVLEKVLKVNMFQSSMDCSIFMKPYVKLNLKDVFVNKVMAIDNRNESFLVNFKYERLGQVLLHCEKTDYILNSCLLAVDYKKTIKDTSWHLGPRLKESQHGKKSNTYKRKTF